MAVTETSTEDLAAEDAPQEAPSAPPALTRGGGAAANDHKVVGSALFGLSLVFLVAGGALALVMRAQLASPDGSVVNARSYETLFTFHGTFLVFLFLIPAWVGLATAIVPLQIGSARLAFPRLQTLVLWLTIAGGVLVSTAPFVEGAKRITNRWSLTSPIPEAGASRGHAVEFLILGVVVVLGATVLAAANLIVTILKMRAPGLTAKRMPLFSWSVLVASGMFLLSLPVIMAGLGMVYVDHHYGAHLFSGFTSDGGGNPFIWPRLFWFGAYPMLWAMVVLALGVASEVIPVAAGRPIADRAKAMGAFGAIGVLAFAGFGSEVTSLKGGRPLFILGALAVLAPVASLFVNWLLTLKESEDRSGLQSVPMLHVAGFVSVLAVGMAAAVVSALDASRTAHTNYWAVGEQHLLWFAPATLAVVAAAHYWGPKVWGRGLSQGLGKLEVLLLAGGAHLAFIPALILGIQNMPAHSATYTSSDNWQAASVAMGIGGAVLTLGVLVFALDLLFSVGLRRGRLADPDPWGGHTLEWTAPTPLPAQNFERLPEIRSATPALDLRTGAGVP